MAVLKTKRIKASYGIIALAKKRVNSFGRITQKQIAFVKIVGRSITSIDPKKAPKSVQKAFNQDFKPFPNYKSAKILSGGKKFRRSGASFILNGSQKFDAHLLTGKL